MNWRVLRRPCFWVDLALALALLAFAARAAHSQVTPESIEKHVDFDDKLIETLTKRVDGIDEKASEMWGIGVAASALAMGSVVIQVRKAK